MRVLISLLLFALVFSSCSSGKKAFEQGNYSEAVIKAVNRLRQSPNHKKSQEALRRAYPLAVNNLEADAKQALQSPSPVKSKNALRIYERLNYLHDEIRHAPGALKVIPNPISYFDKITQLKPQAAEEAYSEGVRLLDRETRETAKEAYFYFAEANEFMPGYKDVVDKMEQAHFEATLKVLVQQMPVPSQYHLSSSFFQDKIEEYLHSTFQSNQFVRFYTPEEADKTELPYIDQYLYIAFDDFVVGNTYIQEKESVVTKDSVKIGEVEMESGEKKPVYGTVNAKVTSFKKQVVSKGMVSMQVKDAHSKAVLTHNKFNGEFIWASEWGHFNGDERALQPVHHELIKKKEVPPPPPQDMFIEFTRPIYSQLTQALETFYRKY